jgi:hypothetical protein
MGQTSGPPRVAWAAGGGRSLWGPGNARAGAMWPAPRPPWALGWGREDGGPGWPRPAPRGARDKEPETERARVASVAAAGPRAKGRGCSTATCDREKPMGDRPCPESPWRVVSLHGFGWDLVPVFPFPDEKKNINFFSDPSPLK